LGLCDYQQTWQSMREFTDRRDQNTEDEIWLLEHRPVYTLGLAGRREHILAPLDGIPVVESDRGGQVTFHGPGQLVAYLLRDLKRLSLGAKTLVHNTEAAVIDALNVAGVMGLRREGAPGIYVDGAKIAALGFRIRRGCCYHGVAVNIDMDLAPYSRINPCGYVGMPVTSLSRLGVDMSMLEFGELLLAGLQRELRLPIAAAPARGAAMTGT
jgi:lipoyl(octanoyl) transferase